MKRKKFLARTLAAAMSLALFSGCSRPSASSGGNDNPSANNTGSTSSEEPIVIKIGHTDSDTRSTHKWSVWLGEWLEDALAEQLGISRPAVSKWRFTPMASWATPPTWWPV